jgi:hypothetical protein
MSAHAAGMAGMGRSEPGDPLGRVTWGGQIAEHVKSNEVCRSVVSFDLTSLCSSVALFNPINVTGSATMLQVGTLFPLKY